MWQQARALSGQGWRVRALCPRGRGQLAQEVIEGVEIRRFRQPFEGGGRFGLLFEYALALPVVSAAIAAERLRGRIDVVQVANPPDWLLAPASLLAPRGARIAFDLVDFSVSLYEAKFQKRGLLYRILALINRWALRRADLVVAANEAYCRLATRIGRRSPGTTVTVYSYPETLPPLRRERAAGPLRIGYFGVLGSQDGVGALVEAAAQLGRLPDLPEFEVLVVGDGPDEKRLRRLAASLGLEPKVTFLGFLDGAARDAALSRFDIAVATDPVNRYTDQISMNKIFVYAAAGFPIVSTPLQGTRRLLGDAAIYSSDSSSSSLACALEALLRNPAVRQDLAARARRCAVDFDWSAEAARYTEAIGRLLSYAGARAD